MISEFDATAARRIDAMIGAQLARHEAGKRARVPDANEPWLVEQPENPSAVVGVRPTAASAVVSLAM